MRAGEAGKKVASKAFEEIHNHLKEELFLYRWLTQDLVEIIEAKVANDKNKKINTNIKKSNWKDDSTRKKPQPKAIQILDR